MTGPGGIDPRRRAGHESDPDYVDKDVDRPLDVERQGEYTDRDVDPDLPEYEREGDYTDKDVGPDDTDTPPGGYTRMDTGG